MDKTRNPIGWGYTEDALPADQRDALVAAMRGFLGDSLAERKPPPAAGDVPILRAKLTPPNPLKSMVSSDHGSALLHAVGRSFRDLAALRSGEPVPAPDVVATPVDERELSDILAWCSDCGYAVIPFGGGSSVVGGVNPEDMADQRGVVTVDLQAMNAVHEVSTRDRVVHAQGGILGPALDAALKPHGLAVRHYPQSYFHSSLGGWVATRGAGHFSTLRCKIEDRVQALSVMLPNGVMAETRPLPASSIGPDPNRLWCGSEGILGVIVDVRLRVVADPAHRAAATVAFADFETALEATRAIVQAELWPAQMRVLDPFEHLVSAALAGKSGSGALMLLGFEGERPVEAQREAVLEVARSHGGSPVEAGGEGAAQDLTQSASNWRDAFFRQPYLRDALLDYAVIADTFETAVPWSALPAFYHQVREATLAAVNDVCGTGGVTCRVTHAYPDGVALYFSFYGPGRHGDLVAQWREIKSAASEAVLEGGGTISHHHAMGRDHRPWAEAEVPPAFQGAIRAVKRELDPQGLMNPGLWFKG